jgi:hypothetical protein
MDVKTELRRWRGIALWMSGRLSVIDPSRDWGEWIERADKDVRRIYDLEPVNIQERPE